MLVLAVRSNILLTTRERCELASWTIQSGPTAIETDGAVLGVCDVARQVDAIVDIAASAITAADGNLDVVPYPACMSPT
jgi:hypothetical protein